MTTKPHQLPLDLRSYPALGREDFFVTGSNEFAVHWITGWPAAWAPFPALILYGPQGCGKTHLSEVWCLASKATVLTASEFMLRSSENLPEKNLVLDRIDLLVGDRTAEEKLFHIYNHFQQNGLYILGLSRVAPAAMEFEIKDVASRLRAAPHAAIEAPDDELLFRVLAKRFHDQGFMVAEKPLRFAVSRMERSWESLDRLVETTIRKATSEKKQISLPLFRDVLIDEGKNPS